MNFKSNKFPPSIAIETTNNCNLNCNYCGHKNLKRDKGFMDIETYKKIIDEVVQESTNTKIWLEFYGEPLLLKYKICYYIYYAKINGLKNVFINTNGVLLDNELSEAIIDSKLDKIVISLDAHNEETYRKIRNNEKFHDIVNNILNLIKIRNRLNSNLIIEVQLVPFPGMQSEEEINNFVKFWEIEGACVKIKNYITWRGAIDIDKLRNIKRNPCAWLFNSLAITWEGNVVQCSCDYNGEYIIDNIKNSSIKEMWNGEMDRIRKLHLIGQYEKTPICKNCRDWDSYLIQE